MLVKLFFLNLPQMNESQMKMIIPPTVGFLVAGVASGICYLLIESLRKRKCTKSVSNDDLRCACCLKPFLVGKGVECNDCGARSCRKGCCRWDSIENSWLCIFCYYDRSWRRRGEKWFRSFGGLPVEPDCGNNFSTAKSRVYDEGVEHVAVHGELDLAAGGRKEGDQMETVREFVERIVEGLVGNVDDAPIDRLYDHPAYDQLLQTYGDILARTLVRLAISLRRCIDNKPATDTPTMAHTALRELVERAADEARKMPCLGAQVSSSLQQEDSAFSEHNYEDLLATAILNKVIEKFQNERVDDNSNVVHKRIGSKHANLDNEMGLDEGVEEGSSSLEPLSQDECSSEGSGSRTRRARLRKEPLSLTIEEQIEEVTTYGSEEEVRCSRTNVLDFRNARRVPFPEFGMDIVDPSQDSSDESQEESSDFAHADVITPVETWEENWLFQKRKIQTRSEPVSMLVPNPSAGFRALIGDVDAEDTSDLSEFSAQSDAESDDEDEEEDDDEEFFLVEAINRSMKESSRMKKIIGSEKISSKSGSLEKWWKNTRGYAENETADEDNFENRPQPTTKVPQTRGFDEKSKMAEKPSSLANERENDDSIPKILASVAKIIEDKDREEKVERSEKKAPSRDANENSTASRATGSREDVSPARLEKIDSDERREMDCKKVGNSRDEDATSRDEREKSENRESIPKDGSLETANSRGRASSLEAAVTLEIPSAGGHREIELSTPPRPGTIAEREHKKWENAAPIENNPYSEENIQKRLLERQYARRSSSDVSGSTAKFPTSPSPPLQIIMGAGRPDRKRFGRDYYINEARCSNGRSVLDGGFHAAGGRPDGWASRQSSLSAGSEYEHHQERARSVETDSNCSTSSESGGGRETRGASTLFDGGKRGPSNDERRRASLGEVFREKIRESDGGRITKNEINARLNNRGNFEDNGKAIKRIDLRSYGFDNDINEKNGEEDFSARKKDRVVNKLDLRSFGYESRELERARENVNIDVETKIRGNLLEGRKNGGSIDAKPETLMTSSTRCLNEIGDGLDHFGELKSAKSVPNIDRLFAEFEGKREDGKYRGSDSSVEKKRLLPSVKRLARAFDKTEEIQPVPLRRIQKTVNNSTKERPTTPEVHIIDTPRQMHSLTARSISREFREGLRQIAPKRTSSPTRIIAEEKQRSSNVKNDQEAILSGQGKLKSNIKFWEEMREKS